MIDEKGLSTGTRTAFLAALLVENMRRRFNVSDADMDELAAGALGMLVHCEARNPVAVKMLQEAHGRLWKAVAGVDAARDGRTVN